MRRFLLNEDCGCSGKALGQKLGKRNKVLNIVESGRTALPEVSEASDPSFLHPAKEIFCFTLCFLGHVRIIAVLKDDLLHR